eukprot:scaffold24091_cov85-Skeletonema_marinoi.AAC.1
MASSWRSEEEKRKLADGHKHYKLQLLPTSYSRIMTLVFGGVCAYFDDDVVECRVVFDMHERPYHSDSTASRLLSEVKHCRARFFASEMCAREYLPSTFKVTFHH